MHSPPQTLVVRHFGIQPRDDFLGFRLAFPQSTFGHDVGAGQLGGLFFVVHADDGAVFDVGVGDEEAFEFCGGDLEAFVFDELGRMG